MHTQAAQDFGQLVIIGEHRAAVAVAAERLRREEARRSRPGQRAQFAIAIGRTERLRGVIDHEQLLRLRDRRNGVVVGRLTEQIDRDHGFRLEAELACHRKRAREAVHIDIEARLVYIDQHRGRAHQRGSLGGRVKCEGRREHGVARADALCHQRHQQGIGTAGAGDSVAGAAERSQFGFDRVDLRTENELAVVEHARDRLVDRIAKPPTLRSDVNERDWRIVQPHLLIHLKTI
jgi:hypothetical protein